MHTIEEVFVAGVPKKYNVPSKLFMLINTQAVVDVVFMGFQGRANETSKGMRSFKVFHPNRFNAIEITSATNQTVKFALSENEADATIIEGDVQATIVTPSIFASYPDKALVADTKVSIKAALAGSKKVYIKSNNANTSIIRIGDTNINAARGIELLPDETIEVETTDELFGFSIGAAAVLSIVEVQE